MLHLCMSNIAITNRRVTAAAMAPSSASLGQVNVTYDRTPSCTHTHTHTHTRTRKHTHTHTHTHLHIYIHVHRQTNKYRHSHSRTHAQTHTHIHTERQTQRYLEIQTLNKIYISHARTCAAHLGDPSVHSMHIMSGDTALLLHTHTQAHTRAYT